jgi:hypothetical protein
MIALVIAGVIVVIAIVIVIVRAGPGGCGERADSEQCCNCYKRKCFHNNHLWLLIDWNCFAAFLSWMPRVSSRIHASSSVQAIFDPEFDGITAANKICSIEVICKVFLERSDIYHALLK